MELALEIEHWD